MTPSPSELEDLRKALEGATPGEWHLDPKGPEAFYNDVAVLAHDGLCVVVALQNGGLEIDQVSANAAFIVLAKRLVGPMLDELAATAKRLSLAEDFIAGLGDDLHHRRSADWEPEAANNAALSMSEDMRLLGNACADYEAHSQSALSASEGREKRMREVCNLILDWLVPLGGDPDQRVKLLEQNARLRMAARAALSEDQ